MKRVTLIVFSLVLLTSLAFSDYSSPEEFEPKYYDNAKVLRVKYTEGESFVKRSYDDGFEEAAINLPIFEKDSAGTTDGRLEVYLGRLNYLRIDSDTEVIFTKVPELRKTSMNLRILKGGVYLDLENLDYERDIEVQTPDCGVFILDKGLYRINVTAGGKTEVFVFNGIAEVAGENFNRNVRENQKVVMAQGRVKERPFYFYSSDTDDFDGWNRKRNSIVGYARYGSSRYLDDGYEEYEYELSRNGRWRYNDSFNTYVWVPYSVSSDWRPYYNGRWVWTPYYGYVWNSYDTWGFFTHHYGRWHWDPVLHWYWLPGYRWSPAWVSWFWDDNYYGWCPISWWNRPVIVYNGRWWRNHHYWRHGIPRHARSTTIIRKNQLSSGSIRRAALKQSAISKKAIAFKGHAPGVKPKFSKVDVINARGNKVVFKKGGIVSNNRYKLSKSAVTGRNLEATNHPTYKYSAAKLSKKNVVKYSGKMGTKSSSMLESNSFKQKNYKSTASVKHSAPSSGRYKMNPYNSSGRNGYKYTPREPATTKSGYRSSGSKSSSSSSSSKPRSSTMKKSSTKSSSSRSRSSSSKKPVKKKESPSYSSSAGYSSNPAYSSSSGYRSGSSSSRRSSSYGSYKPSTTVKKRTSSYGSSSRSSYGSSSRSSYGSSSGSSYRTPSRSSSSYQTPSRSSSSSSYRSSPKRSSGSGSSYKSSSRSSSRGSSSRSSSRSSSGRSSSRSSSSSSSSKGYKKK